MLAPSIRPASMSSFGMPLKKLRARSTVKGTCRAASGRMTAMSSLYMSNRDAVTNSGVSRTASGIVSATRRSQNQISLPAMRSFAKPNAASIVQA